MENLQHLAIASVPIQKWSEVYDEVTGLKKGTIFPELDKPFFVTVLDKELEKMNACTPKDSKSHEVMLLQIQQTGFVLDDLRLYMDTHPDDKQGMELLKKFVKAKKALMREFAIQFYPLTPDCMADIYEMNPEMEYYSWVDGPIPWEGVCS